ncbi:MAG: ATP-binding cassette domain-containing protein [Deltaproteobacteria bacterium]|nr:ATP-binding cassette domain-containing protein [Deltaproteobacteria bacterium]
MSVAPDDIAIDVRNVRTRFGANVIHKDVSFTVRRGNVVSLIGGSGSGKTTLLKAIVGLLKPESGEIHLLGTDVLSASQEELEHVRNRFGMLFQQGALFSALTVGENVATPIIEQTDLPTELVDDLVRLRLALAGLTPETSLKMPSELSGGMRKRAALARALALEPELLFLDEPTSGLDPINARAFDTLIQTLSRGLGITVVMVTHDLDSILSVSDRVIVLDGGKVLVDAPPAEVSKFDHPWVKEYFSARIPS